MCHRLLLLRATGLVKCMLGYAIGKAVAASTAHRPVMRGCLSIRVVASMLQSLVHGFLVSRNHHLLRCSSQPSIQIRLYLPFPYV